MLRFMRKREAVPESAEGLRAEIDRLAARNRRSAERDAERRLLRLRHELGMRLLESAAGGAEHPDPSGAALPVGDGLPEFAPEELTPGLLRAGILRDGCLLVRGLVPRADALAFAAEIDRAFAERERALEGDAPAPGYYEEFTPDARFGDVEVRSWIRTGGGLLAADSPKPACRMLELFAAARLPQLVEAYLGEPPMITLEKTTLRKAEPSVAGAWHQDGHFMGPVRALNVWLSLSRCGDESPGLDLVPRRLEWLVTAGTGDSLLDYQVSDGDAEEAARPKRVIRPVFEPGDALLFDELFLHQTGSDPAMPNPRFAVESWFFGASAFPGYTPIAV